MSIKFNPLILVASFLLFNTLSHAQLMILDKESKYPIINAKCRNSSNRLLGISNINGELHVKSNISKKLQITHDLYEDTELKSNLNKDTIWLIPKATLIEEIVVSSMSNENLYNYLIEKSSNKLLNSNIKTFDVDYYNNRYIIKLTKDTMILSGHVKGKIQSQNNKKNTSREMNSFSDSSFRMANFRNFPQWRATRMDSIFYPVISEERLFKFDLGNKENFDSKIKFNSCKRWRESDFGKFNFEYSGNSNELFKVDIVFSLKDSLILSMTSTHLKDNFYEIFTATYAQSEGNYFLETVSNESYASYDVKVVDGVQTYNCQSISLFPSTISPTYKKGSFVNALNRTLCADGEILGLMKPVFRGYMKK